MKFLKTLKKGFTLVELVIVIAVIAVLSAVLIPVFGNVIKSSKVSALKSDLNTCTNTLVMYSLYNEVDYYTPAVVREFLKSEKIDGLTSTSSKYCLDGYSVWYNQKTFNFQLIKNSEISKYIDTSAASASYSNISAYSIGLNRGNTTHYASSGTSESGATSIIDTLPRRPEAITPDRNMLLVATDEANKGVLKGIEELYKIADDGYTYMSASYGLRSVGDYMQKCELMHTISKWSVTNYIAEFDPNTTAWLNNLGQFVTDAEFKTKDGKTTAEIKNVIVSPDLGNAETDDELNDKIDGSFKGGIYNFDGKNDKNNPLKDKLLNVSCTIEIATAKNEVVLGDGFYKSLFGKANVVISGTVTNTVSNSFGGSSSTVSTVTGGGGNISSAVSGGGSAVSGGTSGGSKYTSISMSSEEFKSWTSTPSGGGEAIIKWDTVTKTDNGSDYKVSVKTPDGKVETKNLSENEYKAYFNNNSVDGKPVDYKYNTSSFSINIKEFLQSLGIGEKDIQNVIITEDLSNGVCRTDVWMLYTKDGTTYGKTFNFGVGYITNFDHYYRYSSVDFDAVKGSNGGENIYPTYYAIADESNQNADAGSLTVKLPEYALNLQSYKDETFTIEVDYKYVTNYYHKSASVFGTDYYAYLGTCESAETKNISWKKGTANEAKVNGSYYALDFGKCDRITLGLEDEKYHKAGNEADYFVNTVQISRIVIKDMNNNILIAKYPQ